MQSADSSIEPCSNKPLLNWRDIDTVLLDMDGTLLDLHYDNYFWLERVPEAYGVAHGLDLVAAQAKLKPLFAAQQGQLSWYCTDYWSRTLGLNIAALKREVRHRIAWLHGAENFLCELQRLAKRLILVTNAHHDSLSLKNESTGLGKYFQVLVTAHQFGYPKEHPLFWRQLDGEHSFDARRTVFIDDSFPVLRAARNHGIRHVVAVTRPDSKQPQRECTEFPHVANVAQLL